MPMTGRQGGNVLNIGLNDNRTVYAPGETIIGAVIRTSPVRCPRARVVVWITGRTKVKIVESNGQSTRTFRSRFALVNKTETSQVLYDGPVHLAQGDAAMTWPFAITVPTHVSPVVGNGQSNSYLPLDAQSVSQQQLPGSFQFFGHRKEGFVEYWLEASLDVYGEGPNKGHYESLQPFNLRNITPDSWREDFAVTTQVRSGSVSSQLLVPGVQPDDLTVKDKMKKLFGTSSVPSFKFQLEIGVPQVLQLENPSPMPFFLRMLPNWQTTSEVLRDIPQKPFLKSVRLRIVSGTIIQADSTFRARERDSNEKVDILTDVTLKRLKNPLYIPCTPKWPAVNIGDFLKLNIDFSGASDITSAQWRTTRSDMLYPTYATYNIGHSHTLEWKIEMDIAGETFDSRGLQRVVIEWPSGSPGMREQRQQQPLQPPGESSEAWIQPPPDGEAPPSFKESQVDSVAPPAKN